MPAQRKPENSTVFRGKVTFEGLPLDGYGGPIPDWPLVEATDMELERWERLWRTAQASQWVRMHIELIVARYVRLALAVESDVKNNVQTAQMITAVTALEDRLGLSAKALQNLSWKISDPETAAPTANVVAKRRIKAVDADAG